MSEPYESNCYRARLLDIVDGDTMDLEVDLGFDAFVRVRVRLVAVDTPEIHFVSRDSEEYEEGREAVAFVEDFFDRHDHVILQTEKDGGRGSYGRWLATIFPPDGGDDLGQQLLDEGLAEPFL